MATGISKERCKYWDKCYRTNPDHLDRYLHPDDSPDDSQSGQRHEGSSRDRSYGQGVPQLPFPVNPGYGGQQYSQATGGYPRYTPPAMPQGFNPYAQYGQQPRYGQNPFGAPPGAPPQGAYPPQQPYPGQQPKYGYLPQGQYPQPGFGRSGSP